MRMRRALAINMALAALLFLVWISHPRAQQLPAPSVSAVVDAERQVRDAEARRLRAFLDHDVKAMSALLADEMIHTTSDGRTRTKTQFMEDFVNRPTAFSQFVTDDMQVIVIGSVAVARGRYHNLVAQRSYGAPLKLARFLRVWVERNGAWQLVSHQATEIGESAK